MEWKKFSMSNLRLINETEVSSGVTTVNITDLFTADFDIYQIEFVGIFHNTNINNGIEGIRFINSGGSVISASEYDYANLVMPSGSSFEEQPRTSKSFIFFGLYTDQLSDGQANASMYIFNPYNSSSYTFIQSQSNGKNGADFYANKTIGVHKSTETIRGLQLYESDGTRTFGGGFIRTYGLRVDS